MTTTENASEAKPVTFASEALRLFKTGSLMAKRIDLAVKAWTPIIQARMEEAGVASDMDDAPHAEQVAQVTLELFCEFLNSQDGKLPGDNQALRDIKAIALVKGAGFDGQLRDWKHLKQVLSKTGNLGSISAGLKYVYQTYNSLLGELGYRQRPKNKVQKEREAAKAAGAPAPAAKVDGAPVDTPPPAANAPAVSQEAEVYAPEGFKMIQVPSDMPIEEAIVALMQAYQVEPGVGYSNLIATLAAAHDYLEQLAASEAVAADLQEAPELATA